MSKKIRVVLFDVDDTLIHAEDVGIQAFADAFKSEFGLDERGISEVPRVTLLEGTWVDGATIKRRSSTPRLVIRRPKKIET